MDALLAADCLPKLAERAMRRAVAAFVGHRRPVTQRALVDAALLRFERSVQRFAGSGVRPALLFGERDRIVSELRAFAKGRLARRLFALRPHDVAALGNEARPFDAIVVGRGGGRYAVALRRLPRDGGRLEAMRALRCAAQERFAEPVAGVLVYDFAAARVRVLPCRAPRPGARAA